MQGATAKSASLSIGDLAKKTGCKVQTIRYYEQIGLMPAAGRTAGNQRVYAASQLRRLSFIRHSRQLGFPLDAIRGLLALADEPNQPCAEADRIARDQLRAVESRIRRLKTLRAELERMIDQCRQGKISSCRIIEVLADHSHAKCLMPDHGASDASDAA